MAKGKKKTNFISVDLDKINIDTLRKLDEPQLRTVIISLLKYIDAQNITNMHGSKEKGIDVYFETLDIFGNKLRWGIQVKTEDLICSARSSNKNVVTILNQVQMAFSKRIRIMTSDRPGEVYIDGFYIITSGNVTSEAVEYIYDNRNKYPNIHIIDGNSLMEIIKNKDYLKQRKIEFPIGSPKVLFNDNSLLKD